ncbi:MAG: hypothetical protein R3B13_10975 [Polyangiaceae bacterium]
MSRLAPSLLLSLALSSCLSRPARFADAPPVTRVADDGAIPMPERTSVIGPVYGAEAYVRRPLVNALDARRIPQAQDINSVDAVPPSSWYAPIELSAGHFETAYASGGPPHPPLRLRREHSGWVEVEDQRAHRYRVSADPPDRPFTSSVAAAISSRLVRALGYRTPSSWVWRAAPALFEGVLPRALRKGKVWQVTHWPDGVVLGATDPSRRRDDDPNDRVPRTERRTLRVLGLVAAWLEIPDFGPQRLADIYVGRAGRGHVRHFLVGLDASLGAAALAHSDPVVSAAGTVKGSMGWNLLTLGLYRPDEYAAQTSLYVFRPTVEDGHQLQMPFDPTDYLLPGDGYWLAKRLAKVSDAFIARCVDEGHLPDEALARHLRVALTTRRDQLMARAMNAVTPLEVANLTPELLSFVDNAAETGSASRAGSVYHVTFLDDLGDPLMQTTSLSDALGDIDIALPEALRHRDYTVIRMQVERSGKKAPAMELHLASKDQVPHVVGIRH